MIKNKDGRLMTQPFKNGLVDALEMSKQHPDTFAYWADDMDSIQRGTQVKVSDGKERFWVTVTKREGNDLYGLLDNNLVFNDAKVGAPMKFSVENVFQVGNTYPLDSLH
jgi:hypothetical protein